MQNQWLGVVHPAPAIPPIEENTTYYDAGPLRLAFEADRELDPDIVREHRAAHDDSFDQLSDGDLDVFDDGGPSVHVFDSETGFEMLRFDLFREEAHYHYLYPERIITIGYDVSANGPMFDWVLRSLRNRLPEMLRFAEHAELAARIDPELLERALAQIERNAAPAPAS